MKKLTIAMAGVFASCIMSTFPHSTIATQNNLKGTNDVKIAVISDDHYYDPQLGTTGKAYENYLAEDRKLLSESSALLKSAVNSLKKSDVNIVLISGDLTKDGEKQDHKQVAALLAQLEKSGKKVYVIDGNHDINNPDAVQFSGDTTKPVDHVTPAEFKDIYKDFGYSEAIAKDPDSLSYVVEPVKGLRIICMDTCSYEDNMKLKTPVTAGSFRPKTLEWVKTQLQLAKKQNCRVIGMMHHGLLPHFTMQQTLFPEYVVKDSQKVSAELADLGMNIVLTGHFHAQDIVKSVTKKNNYLYDIETGSLVTYPCPYRVLELTPDNKLKINTKTIDTIDYNLNGKSLKDYSHQFLVSGLKGLAEQALTGILMQQGLPQDQAVQYVKNLASKEVLPSTTIVDILANAMAAHYQGDEKADPQINVLIENMSTSKDKMSITLGAVLKSLYTDPEPADNNITIDLKTGITTK